MSWRIWRSSFKSSFSDTVWLSYPGPDPIRDMQRDGKTHVVITMHEVNEVLDGGRFVTRSHPVPLVKGADAAAMHRITWPQMGQFIRKSVIHVLGLDNDHPLDIRTDQLLRRLKGEISGSRRSTGSRVAPELTTDN